MIQPPKPRQPRPKCPLLWFRQIPRLHPALFQHQAAWCFRADGSGDIVDDQLAFAVVGAGLGFGEGVDARERVEGGEGELEEAYVVVLERASERKRENQHESLDSLDIPSPVSADLRSPNILVQNFDQQLRLVVSVSEPGRVQSDVWKVRVLLLFERFRYVLRQNNPTKSASHLAAINDLECSNTPALNPASFPLPTRYPKIWIHGPQRIKHRQVPQRDGQQNDFIFRSITTGSCEIELGVCEVACYSVKAEVGC